MPEGTEVDKLYKALLKKGHSKESAARIAQSKSGEALATGKPPKHENSSDKEKETIYFTIERKPYTYPIQMKRPNSTKEEVLKEFPDAKFKNCTAFENGRMKAENEIKGKLTK